jgi:hypothetical protein
LLIPFIAKSIGIKSLKKGATFADSAAAPPDNAKEAPVLAMDLY